MLDTRGLKKHQVLMALYDASEAQGLGLFHAVGGPLSEKEAKGLLEEQDYFDYLKGRIMKIDFRHLDPRLYDRDNGDGAAQQAIDRVAAGLAE